MNFLISDVDPQVIDPSKIRVIQIDAGKMIELQKKMSKAIWKPAPGRKLAFVVVHEDLLLGLIFLASPVINMSGRDKALKLSSDPSLKGKELRKVADISVCVSSQPFGWRWNGGKLMAMIATTLGDFWYERYNDELKHLVTTSLYGKGSQYNRVFKFVGMTKGYGHEHISEEQYKDMLKWMRDNNVEIPSCKFGEGANPKMRRISAYRKASGDTTVTLVHNKSRGIYVHDAVPSENRDMIIRQWYDRWGLPRFLKKKNETPPYTNGLSSQDQNVILEKNFVFINDKNKLNLLDFM
jgi:hypothetical protein